ncbi:MAG: hypothetical protein IKK75_16105 [Clostridia bacterium]|nr:hypothetical protein [Clostridia bacterium]
MMKRKGFVLCLVLAVCMLLAGFAVAETADPIVTSMELAPSRLTGPGPVTVTITISNSSDQDLRDPVVLYDPAAQIVSDFGTNGSAMLKAGETRTWTGTYDVNQRTLDNGFVVYYVKYTLYNENGKAVEQSQSIRQKISLQTAETDIEVRRTISPTVARQDQEVVVRYDISNTGTVALLNVGIQENKDIYAKKQTIPRLEPGQTAEIRYPVKMGSKDITSNATITYTSESQSKEQTYRVEEQIIRFGEPELEATLSSSAKGVVENGTITLTLTLKNTGSVDYSDIRVTDASLGDVFTNQEIKAGKTLELTKEVTVPATTEYQFVINATDATGTETSISTDALSITAVNPADALNLEVIATPDRTEVFEQPGNVRFVLTITNVSKVDAADVVVSHGETQLYTFDSIPAGETRTLSRDFALSMAGKYRFTVNAKDALESAMSFQSNEIQIAFSVPTPAPATPTPAPDPTPEPTFVPATIPPITDRSVGTVPKFVQIVLAPIVILAGVVLLASVVLLIIAAKRRKDQKKASEAAVDQLERAERRDYITPAEEPETVEELPAEEEPQELMTPVINSSALDDAEEEFELPHMKYARSARPAEPVEEQEPAAEEPAEEDYYDEQQPSSGYAYDDGYADDLQQPSWNVPLYQDDENANSAETDEPEAEASESPFGSFGLNQEQDPGTRKTRRSRSSKGLDF